MLFISALMIAYIEFRGRCLCFNRGRGGSVLSECDIEVSGAYDLPE